jgi:hypothetical protein
VFIRAIITYGEYPGKIFPIKAEDHSDYTAFNNYLGTKGFLVRPGS